MMPPPMPTASLASLTEEELHRMEGEERESLEARVQWLRDINTLLDAAVEQMHQYTMVSQPLSFLSYTGQCQAYASALQVSRSVSAVCRYPTGTLIGVGVCRYSQVSWPPSGVYKNCYALSFDLIRFDLSLSCPIEMVTLRVTIFFKVGI